MKRRIKIFDTTLRDGEQAPGNSMNIHEKVEMARQLERLQVDVIEAGFPVASQEDFEAVKKIAETVKGCTVAALCRAVEQDIRKAYQAIEANSKPRIHIFLATSPIHMEYKLKMTPEQVLEKTKQAVLLAKSLCSDVEFTAEDASRSDRDFLVSVFQTAVNAGATVLGITDTVGYSTPAEIYELVCYVAAHVKRPKEVEISIHCHNDLGLAVANSLAAVRAGATQVECTVNGIGERAGNAAMDEIVMGLLTRSDFYQVQTGIQTKQIYRTSRLLTTITGAAVPPNKPVVGANAFAHEAGVHQHGVMNHKGTYEIIDPENIGLYQNKMVLGKHSGKHAFLERLRDLGYIISIEDADAAFEKFKMLADRKKEVTDRDIEAIIGPAGVTIKETYTLHSFVVNSGTVISATAVVRLIKDGTEEVEHVARGDGPIDAAFKAIDRIAKQGLKLENYSIQSVTEGEDALGEVVVKIKKGNVDITGRGLSTDIIEASIKAYLNAVNKAILL